MKDYDTGKVAVGKIIRYSTPITAGVLLYLSYVFMESIVVVLATLLLIAVIDMAIGGTSVVDRSRLDNSTDTEE